MSNRSRFGTVSSFNPVTWWGEVQPDDPDIDPVRFHATCFIGATTRTLPTVGEKVKLVFSNERRDRLLLMRPESDL